MEKNKNYIVAAYKMYADVNGENTLLEETPENQPFWFISGMGMTLPQFDAKLAPLHTSDTFDFVIAKADAFGDYKEELVLELPKSNLIPNGNFNEKDIQTGSIIPLEFEDGRRFNGLVLEIDEKTITVDLNHQLAGLDLHFIGTVLESRPATDKEIDQLMKYLNGGCGGCGGGCGKSEGGCGGCGESEGGCGGCGNEGGCGGC